MRPFGQMTAFEREKIKQKDKAMQHKAAEEKAMASRKLVSEEDYARQMRLDEENTNRCVHHRILLVPVMKDCVKPAI